MSIQSSELKPLNAPLEYREGVSLPRSNGVITQGQAKYDVSVIERKKYVVPPAEVTGLIKDFQISTEPFRHGSLEVYVNGERADLQEETTNTTFRLLWIPPAGAEIVVNYIPASNIGEYVRRTSRVIPISETHVLTLEEATEGTIFFENDVLINVTLPVVAIAQEGMVIRFIRSGSGLVRLYPSWGLTINGLGYYDIELPEVNMELVLDFGNANWIPFA